MSYEITWPDGTLAGREFYAGDLAILSNGNPAEYEIVKIQSVVGDTITLATDPIRVWPPGSRITPLRTAHIEQLPSRTSPTSHVSQLAVRFEFDETEKNLDDAYWDRGTPWPFRTNWATAVDTGYDRIVYSLDVDTGRVETTDPADAGRVTQRAQLTLNGRTTVNEFRSWLAMTRGRALRFWKDSGTHDLEPLGVIGGSTTLDVAKVGYSEWYAVPQDARRAIAIIRNDGDAPIYVQVVSVDSRNGFDRLALLAAIPEIPRSAIDRVSYLIPVRFDQDVFEIEHLVDNLAAVRSSVVVRSSDFDSMPQIPGTGIPGGGNGAGNGDPIKTLSLLHFDNSGLPDNVSTNTVDLEVSSHTISNTTVLNGFAVTNQVYAIYRGNDARPLTNTGLTMEAWVLPNAVADKFNHLVADRSTVSESLYVALKWQTNAEGATTFIAECSATKNYSDYTGFFYSEPWVTTGLVHVALVLSTPNFMNPIGYAVYVNGALVTSGTFTVAEYPNTLTWENEAYFEVRCSSASTSFRTDEARLSNVARYSGASFTVPTLPFVID